MAFGGGRERCGFKRERKRGEGIKEAKEGGGGGGGGGRKEGIEGECMRREGGGRRGKVGE